MNCSEFEKAIYSLDPADEQLKRELRAHYQACGKCKIRYPNVTWILEDLSFPLIQEQDSEVLHLQIMKAVTEKRQKPHFSKMAVARGMAAAISLLLCFSFVAEFYSVEAEKSGENFFVEDKVRVSTSKKHPKLPVLRQKIKGCIDACNVNWLNCNECEIPKNIKKIIKL